MKRRDFLKLTCAVPFMGPIMAQMASDPSRLDKLRAISLRIMHAPKVFFTDWFKFTPSNWLRFAGRI